MLHKLGYDGICDTCKKPCTEDDIADFENGICHDCHEKWCDEQRAHWWPLYQGEKLAGMLEDK